MSVELATVVFDGTYVAERELSALRASRRDSWLPEVAVLEHHAGGRFSMKATSPDYGDEDHVGARMAIGGRTGLLLTDDQVDELKQAAVRADGDRPAAS